MKFRKMTNTYQLTGMTCGSCESKVKSNLLSLENVTSVEDSNTAIILMDKPMKMAAKKTKKD